MSFKYRTTLAIIAFIVLAAAILVYQKQNAKKNLSGPDTAKSKNVQNKISVNQTREETQSGEMEGDDFNTQCENGEWLNIANLSGEKSTVKGILYWVDTENDSASQVFKDYTHYLDGEEKLGLIGQPTSDQFNALDLFQGREVEIEGVGKGGSPKAMEVARIRCTGRETDRSAIDNRAKMLNFAAANIDAIAPEKAKYQKWSADSAFIINDTNIYLDYYDTIQDDENIDEELDTMHRVLLEITPQEGGDFYEKVLAYYVPGEDDYVLKSGTDKFKDLDENTLASYSYDSEENSWTRE